MSLRLPYFQHCTLLTACDAWLVNFNENYNNEVEEHLTFFASTYASRAEEEFRSSCRADFPKLRKRRRSSRSILRCTTPLDPSIILSTTSDGCCQSRSRSALHRASTISARACNFAGSFGPETLQRSSSVPRELASGISTEIICLR